MVNWKCKSKIVRQREKELYFHNHKRSTFSSGLKHKYLNKGVTEKKEAPQLELYKLIMSQ